jgi:hypothetical protein
MFLNKMFSSWEMQDLKNLCNVLNKMSVFPPTGQRFHNHGNPEEQVHAHAHKRLSG